MAVGVVLGAATGSCGGLERGSGVGVVPTVGGIALLVGGYGGVELVVGG